MADLAALLLGSLSPATRKQAEQSLASLSAQTGFLHHLLRLVLDPTQDRGVRLAGSVYFKNDIKRKWQDEDSPVPPPEKTALRPELVPAMIALSGPSDKALRAQIAESISIIAEYDFPEEWSDLIDQLVSSLSPTEYSINVGVLETAHSIFRRWRSEVRSDQLFTVINFVLERFIEPFLAIFRQTASLLFTTPTPPNIALLAQAQATILNIFYDLTCQDLPPAIEDAHAEIFGADGGWFLRLLAWDPPELRGEPDDTTPSLPSQIKASIFEIAELYTKHFPELYSASTPVDAFVRAVWDLIGGGQRSEVAYDALVSQSLQFLSTTIRSGHYKQLFAAPDTISGLIQGVIVPNVGLREHEIEQFEDDPLEYIRLDLALPYSGSVGGGTEGVTRRQAAADVLKALLLAGFEAEATQLVSTWIGNGLQQYAANPTENWRAKDSAIYLLTAVATRGSMTQRGVTSVNELVDIVQFFSKNVFQDLQAEVVHPILQVDAIRYLYTFRNQLTKKQLLSVLPLLLRHLASDNYVCYSYAAITIERILFLKHENRLVFAQADIHDIAPGILNALLTKIQSAGTPEKIAENDYLMKCTMRVIITARQTLIPGYIEMLQRLVTILGIISKNPSNPNFDQYIFESISALMRFVVAGSPQTLSTFEQTLFGPFTVILQQDIDQFIPYVFQLLSQMLELHTSDIPADYRSLLPFLLTPASWQQKGSIPGLVRLLKAFLAGDSKTLVATGQFTSVLAVVQQRLIPSKINDVWGFELLQGVVKNIPPADLRPVFRGVIVTLLTRLQTSKTDGYVYQLVYFFLYTMAVIEGATPDFLIGIVEEVQPQLWSQILSNFVIPQTPKLLPKDRKVGAVGLVRMLTQSTYMMQAPSVQAWPATFTCLVKLFSEPQHLTKSGTGESEDDAQGGGITMIDYEEQNAGYQVAYSRLAASEMAVVDPVGYVEDPREYLRKELGRVASASANGSGSAGVGVRDLIAQADLAVVGPFVRSLGL